MEKFTAKLRGIQETKFPIVKAAFKGKDDQIYIGVMMIDTGSVNCILNKSVLPYLDDNAAIEGKTMNIHSVQGKGVECQGFSLSFRIGNGIFSDTFYVNKDMDFSQMFDGPFIGIIGHEFLRRNNIVLDYETETLHASEGNVEGNPEDYAFFFPMSYGLKQYNIPVVGLVYGDKEYLMVADSGANDTVITKHLMDGTVTCFSTDTLETALYDVTLSIISVGGTPESPKLYTQNDKVQVISNCQYIMEGLKEAEGNDLMPVSGMLSSDFMLKNKWVLDFGIGVMYQRKNAA
ncbi:MAG: retropepsin-like aspartic protease [Prevotellaceae bacterium]|nr:retropepsin-like aspartic protease [Prevotellaceae bacterium]